MTREVVVPLTGADMSGGRNRLGYIYAPAAVAGMAAAGLGIWRWVETGRGGIGLLVGATIGGAIIAGVLAYSSLRLANATVYLSEDRIGVTNALNLRKELPVAEVGFLQICTLVIREEARPMGMFLVMNKMGRCQLRFYGADALRPGGIEEVSAKAGLQLHGSWDDTVSLGQLRTEFPGAVSRTLAVSGLGAQDPTTFFWVVSAVVLVIGLIGGFIYLALQP